MDIAHLLFELERAAVDAEPCCASHAGLHERAAAVIQELADIRAAAILRAASCELGSCPLIGIAAEPPP